MSELLIIFLDIDGVLNRHDKLPSGYCGIEPRCRDQFNRITDETGAVMVISSAWRYLILNGSMTVYGFENLMRTHGVRGAVIGHTRKDTMLDGSPLADERGEQIADWIRLYTRSFPYPAPEFRYVVVDDLDLGISVAGHPFVQTDGKVGITEADADRAIAILKGK